MRSISNAVFVHSVSWFYVIWCMWVQLNFLIIGTSLKEELLSTLWNCIFICREKLFPHVSGYIFFICVFFYTWKNALIMNCTVNLEYGARTLQGVVVDGFIHKSCSETDLTSWKIWKPQPVFTPELMTVGV